MLLDAVDLQLGDSILHQVLKDRQISLQVRDSLHSIRLRPGRLATSISILGLEVLKDFEGSSGVGHKVLF